MEVNGFKILETKTFKKRKYFLAICKLCSHHFLVRADAIIKSKSCGCSWKTPGVTRRLQRIYNSMKNRCNNESHVFYSRYGGAGIKVCDSWNDDSKKFYKWALESNYCDLKSIDRINNDFGYSEENCRWIIPANQARNRKSNVVTEDIARKIQNEEKGISLDDLCKKYNIHKSTLKRIKYKQTWKNL